MLRETLITLRSHAENSLQSIHKAILNRSNQTKAAIALTAGLSFAACTLDRRGTLSPNQDGGSGGIGGMEAGGGGTGGCVPTDPETEVCDEIDNNCNGTVDEGCECEENETRPCGTNEGECEEGVQSCVDGTWAETCDGEVGPATELCDGLDNNCDGEVDDGLVCECTDGDTQSCGVSNAGECTPGMETCVDGSFDPSTCTAVLPALEVCGDNLDQDCDGTNDNGCDVTLTFPALTGADCYKAVHFLSGGVTIESNSSTPDSNQCTKASVTGTYQPGDRAQAWIESDTLAFDATEEPKTVELRCSPFSTDPDWIDSTAAVQANDYGNTGMLGTPTITDNPDPTPDNYVYPLSGCDEYDVRITY